MVDFKCGTGSEGEERLTLTKLGEMHHYTLHYVHQLVTNCVSLLFAPEQVVYSGFIGALY